MNQIATTTNPNIKSECNKINSIEINNKNNENQFNNIIDLINEFVGNILVILEILFKTPFETPRAFFEL